jgi:hypothetical protein
VGAAEAFRDENIERLTEKIRAVATEHLFGLRIDERNFPIGPHHDHRVGGRFEDQTVPFAR